jgi:subtilase family serine protease
MRYRRTIGTLASLGLAVAAGPLASPPAATAAGVAVAQSVSPLATPSSAVAVTPPSTQIDFSVGLQLSDPTGAQAFEQAVSDPKSPRYRHYLTAAQWERRFSPTQASVNAVTEWLKAQGITVESVTPDRMTVLASATAATVARAFGTSVGEYRHAGKVVRLASKPLSLPSSIAALVTGVTGVDQDLATPNHLTGADRTTTQSAQTTKKGASEIPQPEGFRNAPPCSSFYGQLTDTTDPAYGGGYVEPLPYALCGYVPAQLQGAYGLTPQIASGIDGEGVRVAIVDAYAAPTLFADAQHYSELNQGTQVLGSGQFEELLSPKFNEIEACEASEWFGEQTLDIEAVHATAPGAKILYVGAKNCLNGLYNSVQQIVDGEMADIITNSWGDDGGDLLDSAGSRRGFDNILMMAAGIGIGVQFSAGDEGDEFAHLGMTVADYPSSSPYATAVGGTSLEVGPANTRTGEVGWSTSKSVLCTTLLAAEGYPGCKKGKVGKYLPKAPGEYLYGGGGGTSYEYPEPSYQQGVVPASLAQRNSAFTGIPNRVEPDISMDADPTTGMLVGETQTFPDGTYYDQYRIGGTSLASPLFAGVMADADQAAGTPLGFVNPAIYALAASPASASSSFYDVVPGAKQALVRSDYLDGVDAEEGTITSVRTLDYQGREVFCSGTGNCTRQKVALDTAPGFDSMTGIGTPASGLLAALATKP